MELSIWKYIISMPVYIIILLLLVGFMRKYYRITNIFWILALFTFPLWSTHLEGWFRWAKTLSVLIPTIIVNLVRIANYEKREGWWNFLRKDWVLWFFYSILFLNIMEATIKDISLGNYPNALSGFILCITIPFAPKYWEISQKKHGDLIAYTTAGWNLLYTSWNACFVYAESSVYFASSLCILFAAEIYPLIKRRPEIYITARIYTLAFHLLLRATFDKFPQLMNSSSWYNADTLKYWGIINLVFHIPYLFWYLWQLHTGRAEKVFKRI